MNKSWYQEDRIRHMSIQEETTPSKRLLDKLKELRLLYGVPLPYVIPHPSLLPKESIRYFHMDEQWIQSLFDGFCSMGRVNPQDIMTDREYLTSLYQTTSQCAHTIRQSLLKQDVEEERLEDEEVTGILLRSEWVELYKGLEVVGYDKDGHELTILRMEKLQHEILLCMFSGTLDHIRISEPKESMSYGFHEEEEQTYVLYKDVYHGMVSDVKIPVQVDGRRLLIKPFLKEISQVTNVNTLDSTYLALELILNQQEGVIYFDME